MTDVDRGAYLAGLSPGADVDHRGTPFTRQLLDALLDALRDPATGHPLLGEAQFDGAKFADPGDDVLLAARFDGATFLGDASFEGAVFEGVAGFDSATFHGRTSFNGAVFHRFAGFASTSFQGTNASFNEANFHGVAGFGSASLLCHTWFKGAVFHGNARFESATFERDAGFYGVTFRRDAWFETAAFQGNSWFTGTTFQGIAWFPSVTFRRGASFESAVFERSHAVFTRATFQEPVDFSGANFHDVAAFVSTTFESEAQFGGATFQGIAAFNEATFQDRAEFTSTFRGEARFESTTFEHPAVFERATFEDEVRFGGAVFRGDALFSQTVFERPLSLGPLVCAGRVQLSEAVFKEPAMLSLAARGLECRRTRWLSTAELRLRHTTVDFAHAVFEYPLTIAADAEPFVRSDGRPVEEGALTNLPVAPDASDATVRVASLRGVDAAHLVLADVDLSGCLFTGTVHLDQLRLEGDCTFDGVPSRTPGRLARFTPRRTLAEEHNWRASRPAAARGWNVAVFGARHVGPAQLAPVYRALRKAFEDGKNEPGAADFYYGEMEMRRRDRTGTSRAERGLLHGYWMLSGYGLRASRAVGWLVAAMVVTTVLLMGFGLPKDSPGQTATGTVPAGGGRVTFEIAKADPENPTGHRFTGERFEKALNVTLNSVVFRSSGQDLTTAGAYVEMASRLTEPVLLGLAVLAVRNRVKR
ncbi:pentapeptide repeat-containing protein [Streptomyces sp. NPDC047315]|uniref:pentapeptide repeat-containing protein n=1 Tax=Streptomyces sp. NPDC047315 TaxID=3155142 RepID=UPI0033C5EBFD